MELLPEELKCRLPPIHSQDREMEPIVLARYHLPGTDLVWYPIEGQQENGDFLFFGFVLGPNDFRCFRLSELESARGPNGGTIQRHERFIPGRLTDVVPASDL